MLLAFTLLLGLAVPASAEFGSQDSANLKSISDDVFGISNAFRADNYTWDQNNNANMNVMAYIAYALHTLKGTITNSGSSVIGFAPDNGSSGVLTVASDSKDYFISRWKNLDSNSTITPANRWRVQTLSDNSGASWLYQVAQSVAQSGLTAEALMNWSNPSYASYKPSDTANYSWFNQVLSSVQDNKLDVSGLAKESTLSAFSSDTKTALTTVNSRLRSLSVNVSQSHISDSIDTSVVAVDPKTGDLVFKSNEFSGPFFPVTALNLESQLLTLYRIYSDLHSIDEILATPNDRALEEATDDTKVTVKDYVSDKKSNYGDSFTIGNTISDGLKPNLSTSQASSAVGGLFSQDSSDYYGWFSSETDNDLHPGASGASTLSLEDEPSSQDVADSETVWVIDPYASSSDLISDFFGGE